MDVERRAHPRKPVLKTGMLFFAEGRQCLDCLIWNLGECGGLIEVENTADVGSKGRLISEAVGLDRPYWVVWRHGRKVGIAFGT